MSAAATSKEIEWQATLDDLYATKQKAELVGGRLCVKEPTGIFPGRASLSITISLRAYERTVARGFAVPDNVAFIVDLPSRKSFSPDAAYHVGEHTGMKFLQGAPVFAAEVRSEGDYGPAAEREMAAKRADYFAAGTLVVWDVDLLGEGVISVYRASDPLRPAVYRRGEVADAEPALPGWRFPVIELFE